MQLIYARHFLKQQPSTAIKRQTSKHMQSLIVNDRNLFCEFHNYRENQLANIFVYFKKNCLYREFRPTSYRSQMKGLVILHSVGVLFMNFEISLYVLEKINSLLLFPFHRKFIFVKVN